MDEIKKPNEGTSDGKTVKAEIDYVQKTTHYDKDEWLRQRQQAMKEITDKLEAGVMDIFTSGKYADYLKTMSRFHNYSINNQLLIHLQNPTATLVCGYGDWTRKFSRHVRKGETGIKILQPSPYKRKVEVINDRTGEKSIEEQMIMAFKPTSVFDISQTEGKDLPSLGASELYGIVSEYPTIMQAIKEISPAPIRFANADEVGSAKGFFNRDKGEIVIKSGMSELQTIKTAIHEVSHSILHSSDDNKGLDRQAKEVQAESIAYCVSSHFGLDTSDYSFGYVASWSSGKDVKELKESMQIIRDTSNELIGKIEGKVLERKHAYEKTMGEEKAEMLNYIQNQSQVIEGKKAVGHHR